MGNCKEDEAIEILALVRSNGDEKDPAVTMIKYINNRAQNSYWVMFIGWWSGKLNFMRRTQLALWLQTLMQIGTGIAATTIYLPTLFTDAGWGGNKAQWLAALDAIVGVLGTTVSALIRDPLGTRRMLFIDAARQSACIFLSVSLISPLPIIPNDICREVWHVSLSTILQKPSQYGAASVAFIFIFTFIFSSAWLISPFYYPTEIFPNECRRKGNAWSVVGWAIEFGAGALLNPPTFVAIGSNGFYVNGCFNLVVLIPVIHVFCPEKSNTERMYKELLLERGREFGDSEKAGWRCWSNCAKTCLSDWGHFIRHLQDVSERASNAQSVSNDESSILATNASACLALKQREECSPEERQKCRP